MVIASRLILSASNREPSYHHRIDYSATFLHFLAELFVLYNLNAIALFLCHL
jgi:hypothetical protein